MFFGVETIRECVCVCYFVYVVCTDVLYVCVCVCARGMCVAVWFSVCVLCACVWTYVCMYVCMCVCMYVCMYVCRDACMSVYVVCMYVCMRYCVVEETHAHYDGRPPNNNRTCRRQPCGTRDRISLRNFSRTTKTKLLQKYWPRTHIDGVCFVRVCVCVYVTCVCW